MNLINQLKTVAVAALLLIAQPIQAETFYFHNDHLGTPQVLTDSAGTTVWQGSYSPFGEATETTDTVEQNIRFPGQYFEEETGLHYNYFRDYDPATGRYIESDPIGLGGGINTFGYVGGRPISRVDPRGLQDNLVIVPTPFPIIFPGSPPHEALSDLINSISKNVDGNGLPRPGAIPGTTEHLGPIDPSSCGSDWVSGWPEPNDPEDCRQRYRRALAESGPRWAIQVYLVCIGGDLANYMKGFGGGDGGPPPPPGIYGF